MATSRQYDPEGIEVLFACLDGGVPLAVLCGYEPDAAALLHAVGFSDWQGEGFERHWPAVVKIFPCHAHLKNEYHIMLRLCIYLTSPEDEETPAVSSQVVAAFIPSPQALVEIDRNPWFQ